MIKVLETCGTETAAKTGLQLSRLHRVSWCYSPDGSRTRRQDDYAAISRVSQRPYITSHILEILFSTYDAEVTLARNRMKHNGDLVSALTFHTVLLMKFSLRDASASRRIPLKRNLISDAIRDRERENPFVPRPCPRPPLQSSIIIIPRKIRNHWNYSGVEFNFTTDLRIMLHNLWSFKNKKAKSHKCVRCM